jgi:hypothetical protein
VSVRSRIATGVWLALALGCASARWPDEPGLPVAVIRSANLQAGDAFLDGLTARRATAGLPAPVVAGRLQLKLEPLVEALQAGRLSAPAARREAARLARQTYQTDADAWLVACAGAQPLDLPVALVDRPVAVIAYGGAHFRPRSAWADQCAVVVVAITGAAQVLPDVP